MLDYPRTLEQNGVSMIAYWMRFIKGLFTSPVVRMLALTVYYLAIILALIIMYGRGDFSTPPFIYQGF
jgi:hypothetical protein